MKQDAGHTVVTGASSGIGRATARAFAERGRDLVLVARRKERLEELRHEILQRHPSLDVVVCATDLSVPENARRLYADLDGIRIDTWINNAGFGDYGSVAGLDHAKAQAMIRLNVEATTILSALFVRDHRDVAGTQLINVSSCGGYTLVPTAVTYCATKFYVSAFTEGLAHELAASGAAMRVKVLAPAATRTEFGKVANDVDAYDYDRAFGTYHTDEEMAGFLLDLYASDCVVGIVDRETFRFALQEPLFPYAGASAHNQNPGAGEEEPGACGAD